MVAQMCLQSQRICLCVSEPVIEHVPVCGYMSVIDCMSGCEYEQARPIEAGVVVKVVGLLQLDCKGQQAEFVSDTVGLGSHVMEPQGAKQMVKEMAVD